MRFISPRRLLVAATVALLLIGAAACSDDVLGPPDATRCTEGALKVGKTITSHIGEDDCALWNEYWYSTYHSESWTLDVEPTKAYIVRLRPIADENGANTLWGSILAYARSETGDAQFVTAPFSTFGLQNSSGMSAEQMILTPSRKQRISLRVFAADPSTLGAYSIEVTRCPVRTLAVGSTSEPITLDKSCVFLANVATDTLPVAFFRFPVTANQNLDVTATRTDGAASMRLRVRGPGIDVACATVLCTSSNSAIGAGPFVLTPNFQQTGTFTAMLFQQTAGTLTATVGVTQTPAVVAPATAHTN